jgi:hypothetical protein
MFAVATVLAAMFAQAAGPIDIPDRTPLTIAWSAGPHGAGSSALGFADDPPHAWVKNFDALPGHQTQDYFTFFVDSSGSPQLWLNTAGAVLNSQLAGPNLKFTLTASSTGPLKLVFHCAEAGGSGWGNGLDVTITGP